MRIAVFSDTHGNLAGLEAVLGDIASRNVDMIVNLGDILSGPLQPAETADRLMPLNLPTIRGNHERQLLTLVPDRMNKSDQYAHTELTDAHRAWLATLPEDAWLCEDVYACHGTPDSDLRYLLHTVEPLGVREATDLEVLERVGGVSASLILCGHTHIPEIRRLMDGRLIVNPGSAGLPAYDDEHPFFHVMEAGSHHVRYAICENDDQSLWTAELVAVDYDFEKAASTAEARGRDDWAIALRTGRMN
jgi:predicted phosphodiesterase